MRNGTLRYRQPSYKSHGVRYPLAVAQLGFQRARTEENKRQRAAALVEAARSLALETGVASVTLTAVAGRAGIHYSAVRRYFTSHKEVLLHLAAEGWARWSGTVCEQLGEPGPMSAPRVAEALANGLAADPLFCDLLANLHLHLEQEVDVDRVIEVKRTSIAAVIALVDAIESALPALGRSGAFDILLAAYSLAATLWQIANPPERLTDAYAEEPELLPPEWNLDFAAALTACSPLRFSACSPDPHANAGRQRAEAGAGRRGRRTWARLAAVGDQTHASWACAAAEPRLLLVANDSHSQLLPDAQLVLAGVADRGVFDMTLHVGADGLETATTARAVAVARSGMDCVAGDASGATSCLRGEL